MPRPRILRIIEVFPSPQGEGLRQGAPTIFVRLAGCDLRCSFCDTAYAWEGGLSMAEADVAAAVLRVRKAYPAAWVDVTGGEPLLQNIGPLVRRLRRAGLKVQLETNGCRLRRFAADWLTVSPKPPEYAVRPEYLKKAGEVKLVASKELRFPILRRVRLVFPVETPILLQLESNSESSRKRALGLLRRSLREGLPNIRLSVQLHKILGLR